MAKFNYSDIEMAFMFVNSAPPESNVAVLYKNTGEIRYCSDMAGFDDIGDVEEYDDPDQCIEIPHKNELNH